MTLCKTNKAICTNIGMGDKMNIHLTEKQLAWCREHIPAFEALEQEHQPVRQSTREYHEKYDSLCEQVTA
jgi:hypothetical protein